MKIVIIELAIKNFKGIKDLHLKLDGKNYSIFGDNGTGKTTLVDSWLWLISGKDSNDRCAEGRSSFEIKPINILTGEQKHMVDSTVEALISVDGNELRIKKIFSETWTKKRGSVTETLTGHTTKYFFSNMDLEVSKKEYDQRMEIIAPANKLKMLTSPLYFNNELKWEDRRAILLEICGEITDKEIIESHHSLSRLAEIADGMSIDELRKTIKAKQKKINDSTIGIGHRIDENKLKIKEENGIDIEADKEKLKGLNAALKAEKEELAKIENGGSLISKKIVIDSIVRDVAEIERKHKDNTQISIDEYYKEKKKLEDDNDNMIRVRTKEQLRISDNEKLIFCKVSTMDKLRDSYNKIFLEKFIDNTNDICPACEQQLPSDKVIAAKEKALSLFHASKSNDLETTQAAGMALKSEVNNLREDIINSVAKIAGFDKNFKLIDEKIKSVDACISDLESKMIDYKNDGEYVRLSSKKQEIEQEIKELESGSKPLTDEIKSRIEQIEKDTETIRCRINIVKDNRELNDRIAELKNQEKSLAVEYEKLNGELFLTDEFVKAQGKYISDKVNGMFTLANFRLFETQVNGGINPVCETIYKGVPWSTGLNHGGKIMVGMDIIKRLSSFYDLELPLFIDNAEAVTVLPNVNCQVVKLIVNEQDKILRIVEEN